MTFQRHHKEAHRPGRAGELWTRGNAPRSQVRVRRVRPLLSPIGRSRFRVCRSGQFFHICGMLQADALHRGGFLSL